MKGVKGILLLVSTLFVNLVSAYGEQYGTLIGGVYVDTELVFAAILFLIFFLCLMIATRKMNLFKNDMIRIVISMIFSIFGIYGIQKAGVDLSKIVYDIGIERFLMEYFPFIILITLIIALIFWGWGTVLMLSGGILALAGIAGSLNEDIVYNWELTLILGTILFLIGLAINKKTRSLSIGFGKNALNSARKLRRRLKKLMAEWERARREGDYKKMEEIMKQIEYLKQKLLELGRDGKDKFKGIWRYGKNKAIAYGRLKNIRRIREERERQEALEREQEKLNEKPDKNRLARLYGIKHLEQEANQLNTKLQTGWQEAERLHRLANSESGGEWTKSKKGRKYYKNWHKQYRENLSTEKEIKKINERIEKLKSRV